jgi:hypothetical protein
MWSVFTAWCCSENSNFGLIVALVAACIVIWLIILTVYLYKAYSYSRKLFGDARRSNLKLVLDEYMHKVESVVSDVENLEQDYKSLLESSKKHFAKSGLVRFNPYDDTGGNQSFVLALLDEENNGVVISSLHGRDRTRIYAKPVILGKGTDYELSDEEKEALLKATAG